MAGSKTKSRRRLVALLVGLLLLLALLLIAIWLLWPTAHHSLRGRARAAVARVYVVAGGTPSTPSAREDDTGSPAVPTETYKATIRCPLPPGVGTVPVLIESVGPWPSMWTALGQDGFFEIPVSKRSGEATIRIEKFAHTSFRWEGPEDGGHGTCTVTEPFRPTDRGVVVGVVGAGRGELPDRVRVDGCGSFDGGKVDERGEFTLEALDNDACDLSASYRRGAMTVEAESIRIDPSEAVTEIELPMEPHKIRLRGFLGAGGGFGVPSLDVELTLEPDGLRIDDVSIVTAHADGILDVVAAKDPPAGALITSVDGVSTATTADVQVELAERLLAAGTAYTME